jgi:ABC-type transporter Mla subunit MlaD
MEKKALFGLAAIGLFVAGSLYEIGRRNFWFEPKNTYFTHVRDADGLRLGSIVTIAGLRVGEVTALDVDKDNRIVVTLSVKSAVAQRIKNDSIATVFRTFIIGDKRIELTPGSDDHPALADHGVLAGKDTTDLAEFLSGKKLSEIMEHVESLIGGLNTVLKETDHILEKYRDGTFDKTLTLVNPALDNFIQLSDDLIVMTKELKKESKTLPRVVGQGDKVLSSLRAGFLDNHLAEGTLTDARDVFKDARMALGKADTIMTPIAERRALIASLLKNLDDMSSDLRKNPDYAAQALTALHELTITLKALQRTWFLSDHAKDVQQGKPAE